MYGLEGKVAIVTGSGRHKGLGQAMAMRLGEEGCNVVVADLGRTEGDLFPDHGVRDEPTRWRRLPTRSAQQVCASRRVCVTSAQRSR